MIDHITIINIGLGLLCSIIGWLLRTLWQEVKELEGSQERLSEKLKAVEILVAGQYLTREEHRRDMEALFRKLDRIENHITSPKFKESQ